jgi:hypothetical protein
MKKWNGIMRIVELVHKSSTGSVLRTERNILNTMHVLGEDYILRVLFAGGEIPNQYYLGLDSRSSISASDTIANLEGLEPDAGGYERQAIQSDNFDVTSAPTGNQANSPTVLFTSTTESWGPVRNIFMSTGVDYGSGTILISSANIGQNLVVSPGETIFIRMAMSLSGC